MPFGLSNATATFQQLMSKVLMDVAQSYGNLVMCYVDDVIIATSTIDQHIDRISEVLSCLRRAGLKCKPSKCEFLKTSIKYLGRIIDGEGVKPHPESIQTVMQWKRPRNKRELQSFLGFANYYREFIKGHSELVEPMNRLVRKSQDFQWTPEAEESFDLTKKKLCSAPTLALPREEGTFILDTDASDVAISGKLHQEQEIDGKIKVRPIAYGSRMLNSTERRYGAAKAEMLAAVRFVEKYKSHLEGREFVLRVDNIALKWLKTYSMSSDIVSRWISILGGFKIEHRVREKHFNADGLSKKTEYYEGREKSDQNKPAVAVGFGFLEQKVYDSLETTPWLDKDGRELPEQEKTDCATREEVKISILLSDEVIEPEVFPVEPREVQETEMLVAQEEECLNPVECMALALNGKDSAPDFPPVVRDEELVVEPQFQSIKMITPGNLNADEKLMSLRGP